MTELSFWERETFFSGVDVAVIGSGIVGLNAALCLKRKDPKLKVIVLERGMLPMGASSRNAGFACFGSPTELLDDLQHHTEEEVLNLVERRWKGLKRLRENLGDSAIDFLPHGGYEVFDDEHEFQAAADRMDYLNRLVGPAVGISEPYRMADADIARFGLGQVKHMIVNTGEGQIDTGRMIAALLVKAQEAGVLVVNGFSVDRLDEEGSGVEIIAPDGLRFRSRRVLVATNGFARKLLPDYPVVPARAQVLITDPIPGLKLQGTFHYQSGYYYFRNIGNRVLLGGGRNLNFEGETTMEFGLAEEIQSRLDRMLNEMVLPNTDYTIDMRWSGIMGMGPQKRPIIQSVSENIYCAVRMGGMGVAIGSLVGEEAAELVIG